MASKILDGGRRRMWIAMLLAALAWLGAVPPAMAQDASLVGTWIYRSDRGRPIGTGGSNSMLFQFRPDGAFSQRVIFPGYQIDYVGQYQLAPNALYLRYLDYSPKQDCRYGACYPVNPGSLQPGASFASPFQQMSQTSFVLQDSSGPMVYVRVQ